MATMQANRVQCVAVSKDGRWIAAGTLYGGVFLWDAKTYEQVWKYNINDVIALDFSPDSTRLIVIDTMGDIAYGGRYGGATVLDVATSKQVQTLDTIHNGYNAVKYSPDGDRIATATVDESVQVWDSSDGQLLFDLASGYTQSLLWFDNYLYVISGVEIKRFETSTGTEVSRWTVPRGSSFFVLPRHGEFIAYSSGNIVTCWDTSTHTQLSHTQQPENIISLALSPDDRLLAIGLPGKITVHDLTHDLPLLEYRSPFIHITDAALRSWEQNRLVDVEASLTETTTSNTRDKRRLALATRALVRSQLQHWDLAIEDAKNSIGIEPSVSGYIAMSVALIGNGQKEEGCRVFDLAFRHCDPTDMDTLLLIKAVVLFMAGKHNEAVSRIDDLIPIIKFNTVYYMVQAMMYLQIGNSHMESSDYESAIHSFELARSQMRYHVRLSFSIVSLISGWRFDDLAITIRQRLCEALYAAGRTMDAAKSLLELVDTFGDDVCMSGSMAEWISGELVLAVPKSMTPLQRQSPTYPFWGCG
ncbi:quinon protein alcohol dehydrogenase-like superfamily [Boletus edulis]|nr:quinon protein alcohol dehydrogenase-like superfamily [Boletus edulis]